MTEALTTLQAPSRRDRAAARRLAASVDDGSELGRSLRAVLDEIADGGQVVLLRPDGEVTPAEAARILGVTRQFVDRLIADEVLPCRRLPGSRHRRIRMADVLTAAQERSRRRQGRAAIADALGDE